MSELQDELRKVLSQRKQHVTPTEIPKEFGTRIDFGNGKWLELKSNDQNIIRWCKEALEGIK